MGAGRGGLHVVPPEPGLSARADGRLCGGFGRQEDRVGVHHGPQLTDFAEVRQPAM